MYCWSLAWRILSITLLTCEMSAIVWQYEHILALPFIGIEMKTGLFQFCGHCWGFQIHCHIECSTFTASSFRIWNSSTGIPSLALLVVMLPKAHLTSHSRMSGSRWVITPSWLSGSWRSFLYSSSMYCHLFLISFAFVRSIPFLSFIVPIFTWKVLLVSLIFLKRSLLLPSCFSRVWVCATPWTAALQAPLSTGFSNRQEYWSGLPFPSPKEISSLFHSIVSPISLHWSLGKAFLSLLAILWNSAFKWLYLSFSPLPFTSLLFTAICKASSDNHFALFHFFFLGMVLITADFRNQWSKVDWNGWI